MTFWKKRPRDPHEATRAEYSELREQARKATMPADRARLQNLAGDLALTIGDEAGALSALGEALDIYLRDRDYHSARAVARKLLRVRSKTVRVRSTLAWLAIAQEFAGDARVALDLYVGSLATPGDRQYAIKHLTAMAAATRDRELRTAIADHLADLGERDAAAAIMLRLQSEESGELDPPDDREIRARWEDALDQLVSPAGERSAR